MTFLDILGFSGMVSSQPRPETSRVLKLFQKFSAPNTMAGDREPFEPYAMIFSDSVVRVRPIRAKENRRFPIGLLFQELLDLLLAQGELIGKGVLVRGAVTVGGIAVERPAIFGPGFIEAYIWESQIAKYPRIVVADAALKALEMDPLLRAGHHNAADEQEDVLNILGQAEDGVWFIDYLRGFPEEMDGAPNHLRFLEKHRDLIRATGNTLSRVDSVAQKYMWLSRDHNSAIDGLSKKWLRANRTSRRLLRLGSGEVPGFYSRARS